MSKRLVWSAALLAMMSAIFTATARGTEATVTLDMYSAYVWRGMTFNDGFVLQPSLDVALPGGFGVNVWGNFDLDDYGGRLNDDEFSELDVTLSYSLPLETVDLTMGVIQYTFPQQLGPDASDTIEIYASASYEVLDGLSCGLDVYYDVDQVDDYYASASLSYARDLAERLGGEINTSAGYVGGKWSANNKAGFFDYSVGLALTYAVTDSMSAGISASFVGSLDGSVLTDDMVDETFFYGASVSGTF